MGGVISIMRHRTRGSVITHKEVTQHFSQVGAGVWLGLGLRPTYWTPARVQGSAGGTPRCGCLNEFLNAFFIVLDGVFPLFGVIAYGCFAFYLLWASVKGVTKLGMRLLFFEVRPGTGSPAVCILRCAHPPPPPLVPTRPMHPQGKH